MTENVPALFYAEYQEGWGVQKDGQDVSEIKQVSAIRIPDSPAFLADGTAYNDKFEPYISWRLVSNWDEKIVIDKDNVDAYIDLLTQIKEDYNNG